MEMETKLLVKGLQLNVYCLHIITGSYFINSMRVVLFRIEQFGSLRFTFTRI